MNGKKIREWFINNALTLLTIVLPALTGIGATVKAYLSQAMSPFVVILISALIIILFSLLGKAIWDAKSYKAYRYPWSKIRMSYDYEVIEKKVSYDRVNGDNLEYKRTMKIKCVANHLDGLLDKYIWTGGQTSIKAITPKKGIADIKEIQRIGIWTYISIRLQNSLSKGGEAVVEYEWPIMPNCHNSSPFFSASTDEPTKLLTLSLSLGREYAHQQIICEEFRAIESDYPISSIECQLDDRGQYTWEVSHVKRFRYYRIRWSWSAGQPATVIEPHQPVSPVT